MNRLHLACFSLIASAFVLAGLLIVVAPNHLQQAQAEMVVNKDTVTMMTTLTRPDEEALFVIDSLNERLLVYRTDMGAAGRGKLDLAANLDLKQLFGTAVQPGAGGGGNRRPR